MLPRPHPHVGVNPTAHECVIVYGISEKQEQVNDIWPTANLKYKCGNRHFGRRGYYVDAVGKYEEAIREYINHQLEEDIMSDQLSLKEFTDPFTGKPVKEGK